MKKSGLEDKIKIGSLSTIQLETERHIVEIFGSRSSVGVDLHHMRGPKGGGKYTEAIVQFDVLMAYLVPNVNCVKCVFYCRQNVGFGLPNLA